MAHYNYEYNGKIVPSVTTILAVVDKNLTNWANRLGLSGVSLADHSAVVTGIGTLTHYFIEIYLKKQKADIQYVKQFPEETIAQAKSCFGLFYNWMESHTIEPIALEQPLTSERYGGTLDALVNLDGNLTILDWKTSKTIYSSYYGQLAAYASLVKQHGYGTPKSVGIVLLPKEEGASMEYKPIQTDSPQFEAAKKYFEYALELYTAKNQLQNVMRGI